MLITFDNAKQLIEEGKILHIAGNEELLKKLPCGNWIGGSTEYFMVKEGGKVTDNLLFVTEFPYENFMVKSYNDTDIQNVASEAFDNGFSIIILPYDSLVHKTYAQKAADFKDMFIKNITGWVSGTNLNKAEQTPITVNGKTGEINKDKAVALHLEVPSDKKVNINIINIFEPDESSQVIEFAQEGFSVTKCIVDGEEITCSDCIKNNKFDIKLPLIGDYSGNGVNVSVKAVDGDTLHFYAPVFSGIKYKTAKKISDYAEEFNNRLSDIKSTNTVFSCNCILNFLYGGLEGKKIDVFEGAITFGEIAYQLINQTLVYVTVE
jgi:hypothetical protein